jgi:1-acyl-sn-glycerol-3-phosphate acyltransferase
MMQKAHALPLWRRLLIALIRGFYFRRVRVVGVDSPDAGPRLLLFSHRNGAIDGYLALVACPRAQFVLSAQLLRNPLLRFMFAGIPLVREKDRQRYNMARGDISGVIESACAHIRAGGALAFFPEGSSEWGAHPLPYQAGYAHIIRRLLEEGITPQVVPLGLFYRQPDGFRSDVEIMAGASIELPPRKPNEPLKQWEKRLRPVIETALDAVSVNCPDMETLGRVEQLAASQADSGGSSYAQAFLHWQEIARTKGLPEEGGLHAAPKRSLPIWAYPFIAVFCLMFAPILLAGFYIGKKADARNTVTFFRMIGGLAAALVWIPALLALCFFYPLPTSILLLMAWEGWFYFPGTSS